MFSKYWLNYSMIANDDNNTFISQFLRERRSFKFFIARVNKDDAEGYDFEQRNKNNKKKYKELEIISKKDKDIKLSKEEEFKVDEVVK